MLIACYLNSNVFEKEKMLLDIFTKTFTQRKDIGREYFEGDIEQMTQILQEFTFKK